jgi:hypothetical protein
MDKKEVKIRVKDEDLKGSYANLMMVRHTKEEFSLDFINSFNPPILTSRIITSPGHLKRMVKALQENIEKYEKEYGKVQEAEVKEEQELGFRP